jgi:hypothetical protein
MANRRFISPGYLATMRIPLLAGRDFSEEDRRNPRVVIVSEKTAKAVWPDENPLGRTIRHWDRFYTVVGVTADARINDLKRDVAVYYLPYWDFPPARPVFLVRSAQTIQALGPEMRRTIWSVDPDISIPTVISLDAQLAESVAAEKFQTVILSSFGGAALLLAVLGIYGVLAYSVSLRTQEFGIRIALGSGRARLVRQVLLDASYPMAGGLRWALWGRTSHTLGAQPSLRNQSSGSVRDRIGYGGFSSSRLCWPLYFQRGARLPLIRCMSCEENEIDWTR